MISISSFPNKTPKDKTPKLVHVIGGGTVFHVSSHLALASVAYGSTARRLTELCRAESNAMDVCLHLTKMADQRSDLETVDDLRALAAELVRDLRTKIIFFNPAIVDFTGQVNDQQPGKYEQRLKTSDGTALVELTPQAKIVNLIRNGDSSQGLPVRKDIFLVSFKATCGATEQEQYQAGLDMLKRSSSNLVLANDVKTRLNMVITPEEAAYHVGTDRDATLRGLVQMAYLRSHLTFTHSTVVSGEAVPWQSPLVPETLRTVVNYCIEQGAYRRVRGVTAGHFAVKLSADTFLTSRRKTDFNQMHAVGLVKVQTDGPDSVIAYGSKPSVGGQSQRIVFERHPDCDCIVHFHCPIRPGSTVPTVSQREYECGSHECGSNTAGGLERFGNLYAVYLDQHGPNIVFNHEIDPVEVQRFIEANFDLSQKTVGYQVI
jgi:hypothetical protein